MGNTPTYGWHYPEQADPADVPTDMHTLATGVEATMAALAARVTALEGAAGSIVQLASLVLAAPAATMDFPGLNQGFQNMLIFLSARSDNATNTTAAGITFNGGGVNADYQQNTGSAAAASAAEAFGAASVLTMLIPGSNAPANVFGGGVFFVPGYTSAAFQKHVEILNGAKYGIATGNMYARAASGFMRNAAAINRVTLAPGVGNFIAGSQATIYGLR